MSAKEREEHICNLWFVLTLHYVAMVVAFSVNFFH